MEKCGIPLREVSDKEKDFVEEEENQGDVDLIRIFKAVLAMSSKPRSEVPTYDGILNAEEIIGWINVLDKYFDYEEIAENKRVKFVVTKLNKHAFIYWDGV